MQVLDPRFNAEVESMLHINVTVADHGTPSFSRNFSFMLHVIDVNEPPYDLHFQGKILTQITSKIYSGIMN